MRTAWVITLVAGLVLVAGCGGGSSDSTGSAAAGGELSKAEWIAQVDEICKAQSEDIAPLNKKMDRLDDAGLSAPEDLAEYAALLRKALPRSEQALRESREVEPPSGESDAIDALLDKSEEALDLLAETGEEMEEGNLEKAKRLSFKTAMAVRTARLMAARDGLEVCGVEK